MKLALRRFWVWVGRLYRQRTIMVQTYCYGEKEGQALLLDWYSVQPRRTCEKLVLFVHGGGFSEGTRDDPRYVQFANKIVHTGIEVVSISYRLSMRGKSFGCDQAAEEKMNAFRCASEDIWDATKFILSKVPFGTQIILCGSSAGAEAVLHAAYWPAAELPHSFKYAGVIGMAAAIMHLDWITSENALPTLLFHGMDDPLVPFYSESHHYCRETERGFLLLHGSGSIAKHMTKLGKNCQLFAASTGGHGWADKPMFAYCKEISRFICGLPTVS